MTDTSSPKDTESAGSGPDRLAGRVALITGASRGIGAAVARRFAAEGAQVVLTARTQGGLEEVDDAIRAGGTGHHATLVPLDLREDNKIEQLAAAVFERFGRLDVLVGNAGRLGQLSPVTHTPPDLWNEVMSVNLTANYRLIRVFDPLLQQSEAGRALFVTAGAARAGRPFWGSYAVSKAALEMLVQTYAAEISRTSVRANLIDPGAVRTTLRAEAFPGEDRDSLSSPDDITDVFVTLASTECDINGTTVSAQPPI